MDTAGLAERLAGRLARGRAAAEAMMLDTGVVRSPSGSTVGDDGLEVQAWADEFTTPCNVQGASTGGSDPTYTTVTIGGVERQLITAGVSIPIGKPSCERGWVLEVTEAGPESDPRIVGRKYLIHNDPAASFKTARRLDVVEV